MRGWLAWAAALACCACSGNGGTGPGPITPTPPPPTSVVLVGAGDIAGYGPQAGPESTAKLLDSIPGTVFTTGDNVNNVATMEAFKAYYEPTWGRHKSRTYPSPGNHDYDVPGASAYFSYFGPNAGPSGLGYYSYPLGSWHVVSLDSEVAMGPGSAQAEWLAADLGDHPSACTLAYWHQPLFSSAIGTEGVRELWRILYRYGADVVVNGHQHMYERFAAMNPDGMLDNVRGIREFVVGTGGAALYGNGAPRQNSEALASVHGVLKLTLREGAYDWEFVPVPGQAFRDSGTGPCH